MKRAGVRVGVGTRFAYDGEVVEVVECIPSWDGGSGNARLRTDTVRRFALGELMFSERSRLLGEDLVDEVDETGGATASVKWAAVPESARSQARERAVHVREVLTGYRSGSAHGGSGR